ncbi:MAG: polyprenyl synthetase family protein [Dehalococcoidales bacterium]|nr:polyprenyl synthetase family protein [Dehalococcoidales bacterium]
MTGRLRLMKRKTLELSEIYAPVQEDLDRVEDVLKSVRRVDFSHLSELLDYSLKNSGGKRIRPMLTLLVGKSYDYNLDYLLPMATAVEILHTATLIHDDSIDKSVVRRGRPTVNKLWGEEQAILLGDYLFAAAGALTASTENLRTIKLFAETLKIISSGEINQALNAFNPEQTSEQYFQRVAKKTAALFVLATESGAVLSRAPEESIQVLVGYGYNLGIAFQIVDDILDFIGTEEEIGKPVGADLMQGTLTLPVMLLRQYYPEDNRVKRLFRVKDDPDDVKQVIELVCNSPSIMRECYQVASVYCAKACRNLKRLPDQVSRRSLFELADYTTRRRH